MAERWEKIDGFPGYEVSDHGRVRSFRKHARTKGRLLRGSDDGRGYRTVCLHRSDGTKATRKIHGLVLSSFRGPRPPRHEASHLDGDKTNNTLRNLRWETRKENHARKVAHGTAQRGERSGTAKLDADTVRRIRNECKARGDQARLAREVGVSPSIIGAIVRREKWAHVD